MATSKIIFADIAFPALNQEFTYSVPGELKGQVRPGSVVSAPFRRGIKTGFVTVVHSKIPPFQVKEIEDILFDTPVITDELIRLSRWMSEYYFSSSGAILQIMLPVKLSRESVELISLADPENIITDKTDLTKKERKIVEVIAAKGQITPKGLQKDAGSNRLYYSLDKLKRKGVISIDQKITTRKISPKVRIFVRPALTLSESKQKKTFAGTPAKGKIYSYILNHNPVSRTQLLRKFSNNAKTLNALCDKGLVEKFEQEIPREYLPGNRRVAETLPPLTSDQSRIVKTVLGIYEEPDSKRRKPEIVTKNAYLLHGVTGSGKTRVYLELIRETLKRDKGAILLVPEIALTDYFLSDLRAHFGDHVAVLHSRMSQGERYDSWRAILTGRKNLVIGPRSAVFAPVKDLSLIIVDEEHDASYKQHDSPPYYHARDIAVYRGRITGATVVLGSATPSMESYYNALNGKYHLVTLPERIDGTPLPEVRLIDLKQKENTGAKTAPARISEELLNALDERLKNDEQVLIMQNRRGYSTHIQCSECGVAEECENCKITLTYHKHTNCITCHFCGYTSKAPTVCRECGGNKLYYSGIGTQQVEEAIKEAFPGYKTVRMDLDTTRSKSAHIRITEGFERGTFDILVGTQMIAKGFDFGNVNLVGIISADTGLLMPEFRAGERTYQLLTQAAGRAGRRKKRGKVLIQTYHPDHYSLVAAKNHDYDQFYKKESAIRSELNYPPFGRIVLLRFSSEDPAQVENTAAFIGNVLRRKGYRNYLLGPAPAPIEKLRNRYRWFLFLRSGKKEDPNGKILRNAAATAREHFEKHSLKKSVRMTIDVDPVNLM